MLMILFLVSAFNRATGNRSFLNGVYSARYVAELRTPTVVSIPVPWWIAG